METVREVSEAGDTEDIPSDFFDDFNKAEFMEGLSVIDEWDESNTPVVQKRSSRIDMDAVDSVRDLRELIGDNNDDESKHNSSKRSSDAKRAYNLPKRISSQESDLDDFIRPGSRRDPSKTSEAIKKDKEIKVQQFLAKSLEASSMDDLRPPGTELDDYFEDYKRKREKKELALSPQHTRSSPKSRHSPRSHRNPQLYNSPHPRRSPPGSPRRSHRNISPSLYRQRNYNRRPSPFRTGFRHYSPGRRSPPRHSPLRRSPQRRSPYRRSSPRRTSLKSPRRSSPIRHSPRRQRSRSPRQRFSSRTLHSQSPQLDNFLYPNNSTIPTNYQSNPPYLPEYGHQYTPALQSDFTAGGTGYHYPQVSAYGTFSGTYAYADSQAPLVNIPPAATVMPAPAPGIENVVQPAMVPAPPANIPEKPTPYDALAQLVAEGKISQEDYLKLTPNKGVATPMDTNTRVMVLTRCQQAISKLDKLLIPYCLTVNNTTGSGSEDKYIAPKYCSPLKRQVVTEFSFTKGSVSPDQQTKQLIDSIISTLGLDKVISKYKKKLPKNLKDVTVQTTKLLCEVCEIRESTKYHDVGTSTEPEYFTSTVHTQVVEQDLISSKAIFNPSGSIGEGAAISISHLTPAQLVSQLAARAKTLKQPQEASSSSQFSRRPNYDYDPNYSNQQYHHSYNNYRY